MPTPGSDIPGSAIAPVTWADDARRLRFEDWMARIGPRHGLDASTLAPASADASFRRYFRVGADGGRTLIVMDAPPPREDVRSFIKVAAMLDAAGLNAPRMLEQDVEQGFLLFTDLGSRLYLPALLQAQRQGDLGTVSSLMRDAIQALVQWQVRADPAGLPAYDEAFLRRELAIFPEWCVGREHGVEWTGAQQEKWQGVCDLLVGAALAQPTVAVHRDYMPRNLMVCAPQNPGILDFQDAVRGPVSYDIASMLRDAFISWEEEQEIDWAVRYWSDARKAGVPLTGDFGDFWKQLEWMGLQRHLKVLGIFCRLKHRDGKPKYSEDLPRFFGYAHKVARRYNGLGPLAHLLEPLMGATRQEAFF